MYRCLVIVCRLLIFLVMRRRISGLEHTPKTGGVLVVSNHLGLLDPIAIGTKLPRRLYILAKAEMFSWPVIGWLSRKVDVIPVRRGQSDRDAIRRLLEHLEAGHAVLLFPEGTYPKAHQPPAMMKAQSGAAMLALRSGATILPIGIWGSERVWSKRGLPWNLFRRWRVEVRVGEAYHPTIPAGLSQKQALALIADEMMQRIAALLPEQYRGYYQTPLAPGREASALALEPSASALPEIGAQRSPE